MEEIQDIATEIEGGDTAQFERNLKNRLVDAGAVKEVDFARAKRVKSEQLEDESLVSLLVRLGMVSERAMAEAVAEVTGQCLVKATDYPDTPLLKDQLSGRFLKEQLVIPVRVDDGVLELAMADPVADYPLRAVAMASGMKVKPCVGISSDIQKFITQLYLSESDVDNRRSTAESDDVSEHDVAQLRDMASEAPVIRLVNQVVQRAVDARASDIHIEPFENQLKIRYRIDGVLRDEASPSQQMGPAVISRVKIMADLDIAERRLPQDGRINLRVQGKDLDIRVSTIPTMYGESVVMRLLHRETVALDFPSLGFSDTARQRLKQSLDMPHGMIVVTGPTGSGKTTTLYTALNSLNTEERKVITVEDPVEYNLAGINQIQVNSSIGLSFSSALRSIVRQDPDVIMVGEMRDLETAKICVQSALTGHLVLSTLHTNDAASSITRLMEMGVEDYLLNSTLNMVVAQRLVRTLCEHCREPYSPNEGLIREFGLDKLHSEGELQLYHARGCEGCGGTGYLGRVGIIEMLPMSDPIRELILQHASARKIEQAAKQEGMHSMFEDGCHKVLQGLTTIEEVVRVTQEA
ncbi:MAG TPA: type II secretion system protein GspE [Porticoccus sp.]|nr:type II secretion system protein GspE [Porticoccus sp.]